MADSTPPQGSQVRLDNWIVLLDPAWQSDDPDAKPPPRAIAGGWPLGEEGKAGPFQPNPDFAPVDGTIPTDPTDAVLRLVSKGEVSAEHLVSQIRDAVLEIAVDEDDHLLVGPAPDGVPCVAVTTAPAHKARVTAPRWRPVTGDRLPEVVPDDVDVLLNPDGPAAFRLRTDALRGSRPDATQPPTRR
ncbi:MAG TPA: type VII secretion system-associated protein [Pseudonocardiaceae bacterium]